MKNIIINYCKQWGNDGTVYTQTIKINKKMAEKFNAYIQELKQEATKKFVFSNADMKILYYLEELKEGKNYTTLSQKDYFIAFYLKEIYEAPKKDRDFERILDRNTIFEVI